MRLTVIFHRWDGGPLSGPNITASDLRVRFRASVKLV